MSEHEGPEWYEAITDIGREVGRAIDEQIEVRLDAVDEGLGAILGTTENDKE